MNLRALLALSLVVWPFLIAAASDAPLIEATLALENAAAAGRAAAFAQGGITRDDAAKIPTYPPQGLTAAVSPDGVLISWEPSSLQAVESYVVFRRVVGGQYKIIGTVQAPDPIDASKPLTFLDRYAPAGTEYTVSAVHYLSGEGNKAKPVARP